MKRLLLLYLLVGYSVLSHAQPQPLSAPDDEQLAYDKVHAVGGDTVAMLNMGLYYTHGLGLKQDYALGLDWLQKAADKGYAKAMLQLALMYEQGTGVKKDITKALAWLRKAADHNNAGAINELGVFYENGIGVSKNEPEAAAYYLRAANLGATEAMTNAGLVLMQGKGVKQNLHQARQWLLKAADAGDVNAMHCLGYYYQHFDSVNNCGLAIDWYLKAANHGDSQAVGPIGVISMQPGCTGTDQAMVARWMEQQANKGDADALFFLAGFYLEGKGVTTNHGRAMELMINVAELLIKNGTVESNAMRNLFVLYNSPTLDDAQKEHLLSWFEKTALTTGNDSLMADIGNTYLSKEPVGYDDYVNAMKWSIQAAAKGNAAACYNVAYLYSGGLGVAPDDTKAFDWMLKAARKGDKDAMAAISDYYEKGLGTPKNHEKALEWARKARQ